MALPQVHRLRRRQDFSLVYQQGRRYRSAHLNLRTLYRGSLSSLAAHDVSTRIGIVVSLKVDKRATVRNRIKRQLRAICSQLLTRVQPGWDLVIGVHSTAVQCDYLQFLQELEQLLLNAEVLNGHK